MKIIFLTLLLFGLTELANSQIIRTQETFFTIGDTTETFQISGNAKGVLITVVDSSLAGVDTIYVQGLTGGNSSDIRYSTISALDMNRTADATYVTPLIPTNGLTRSYLLDQKAVWRAIRIVRSNESTDDLYAPKTRIVVTEFK